MSQEFKLDMTHLQKVQRSIKKSAQIFPNEEALLKTLEEIVLKVQDDNALNTYYSMATYLKKRLVELKRHLQRPVESVEEALVDTQWSINYLEWLVSENEALD